jgi:hypothetical protein
MAGDTTMGEPLDPAVMASSSNFWHLYSTSRNSPSFVLSDIKPTEQPKLHVLIAANGQKDVAQAEALMVRFSHHAKIETIAICDEVTTKLERFGTTYHNEIEEADKIVEEYEGDKEVHSRTAYQLCEWADLLVLAPVDANTLAMMLHGMTGNLVLEVLRSWDVSKKIILVPGMTTLMWEHPMTKKQLNKLRKKWNWVRVMQPILWHYDEKGPKKVFVGWDGFSELVEVIKNQAELMTIGHDVDITATGAGAILRNTRSTAKLPPEIWSIIFQHVGDWEVAKALGVFTNLPTPKEWDQTPPRDELQTYMRDLEYTILTRQVPEIIKKVSQAPASMPYLSSLCVKLIIKFCLTDLLSYLEKYDKDLFWATFGSKLLPTKASAVYGRTEILEWWRTSPSFLKKDYTAEAIDGASQSGFIHVLDWWRKSGLPLKYTEAALEQASSKGRILVLEWWKEASAHQGSYIIETSDAKGRRLPHHDSSHFFPSSPDHSGSYMSIETPPLTLKVGKSIISAAQNGQVAAVRWWDTSGIPYSHGELVAKIASAYGHVNVLETWKELKGEKFAMSFDYTVLVGPTKNGFVKVLEWWKNQTRDSHAQSGSEGRSQKLRVEYKTCDIEEALEDMVRSQGGDGEDEVRKWWARNGLNLGVGTSEWMKVKAL